jgi:hypothetical protein
MPPFIPSHTGFVKVIIAKEMKANESYFAFIYLHSLSTYFHSLDREGELAASRQSLWRP